MNTLSIVLSSICGTILLVIVVFIGWKAWTRFMSALQAISGIEKYFSGDQSKTIQALLEGQMRMSAAQIAAITELRKAVKGIQDAIFRRDEIKHFETPTEDDKNFAWEAKKIQEANPELDYATALMRAVERETKDLNGPAGARNFEL